MTLTLVGWILIVTSIATWALIVPSRSASPDLLSRLRSSTPAIGQNLRGSAGTLIAAAAVFLLVAGVGAATSYVGAPSKLAGSGDTAADSQSPGPDGEILALNDYARSIGAEDHAPPPADSKPLPDVNTMIERLAARLETAPDDVNGWRMLGWSYFNTERYDEAAKAYAKAMELDPNSDELKRAYEQAKAKASGSDNSSTAAAPQPESVGKDAAAPSAEKAAAPEAKTQHMGEEQIRAMVDGLAARLESSPRDPEGWARLMRSRVVLGEREVAATAFRKALEVFKDDSEASARITAAATELGLKAE